MSNIVAIVGRPNVGKSTLFNRLTESRAAIVDEVSGVTRDRHYGKAEWTGRTFSVIDTGGYVSGSDDIFEEEIRKQVKLAIDEADLILFLTDVSTGLTDLDTEVAKLLRKSKKKIFLVVNKVDNPERAQDVAEFYKLGLGDIYELSSASGAGTGELLDDVVKNLKKENEVEDDIPKIAIIGQPNVGKSSLLNEMIGDKRTIVTPIAGTTRDSIYVRYQSFGFDFYLVDTAGLRKKTKVHEDLEFYSVMRAIRSIEEADVCLLMIDATMGLNSQDINIFHLAEKNKKGVLILVNKWDLIPEKEKNTKKYEEELVARLAPFKDVPVVFTSVIHKQRIHKALEVALEVYKKRRQRIPTSKLNKIILPFIESYPPPVIKGKSITIKYITQLQNSTPHFAFFANLPQYIKEPYRRFIENKMRENFDFKGVPISIHFRPKAGS
ncbi:MAG TPA: ribosome biogenesis GTPase Der [Bacteroidia bacterium]|nr:ribosome biogenesis GTPase Der [Bacteroidia bacterium]